MCIQGFPSVTASRDPAHIETQFSFYVGRGLLLVATCGPLLRLLPEAVVPQPPADETPALCRYYPFLGRTTSTLRKGPGLLPGGSSV